MQTTIKEKLVLVFISFWAIIITVRIFIFETLREGNVSPVISISGLHIHHFLIGFFLLLIAAIIFYFANGRKKIKTNDKGKW